MPRSKRTRKGKRKVALPKDRTGRAIHIGDTVAWGDGTMLKVAWMTYFGKVAGDDMWEISGEGEDDWSDNPSACEIIWRPSDHE